MIHPYFGRTIGSNRLVEYIQTLVIPIGIALVHCLIIQILIRKTQTVKIF